MSYGRSSAAVYAAVYLLTLLDAVTSNAAVAAVAATGALAFVVLEWPRIRTAQRIATVLLTAGGLGAAYWHGGPGELGTAAFDGLRRALPFMVLFAAVMHLQPPALASPSFRALGETVVRQPPGRRFLMLAFAGHYLGAVLNLAGLQLVVSLLDPSLPRAVRQRLIVAPMRGFSAAVLWSPFFVGMGVILTVLPEASWLAVAPGGLLLGAGLIVMAWAIDRVTRRRHAGAQAGPGPAEPSPELPRSPGRAALGVAIVFAALAIPVVGLSELGSLSIVIALGFAAPPLALLWQARLRRIGAEAGPPHRLFAEVFQRLPGLRNEAALFLAATVFGVGLAGAIEPEAVAGWSAAAAWPLWAKTCALTLAGTLLGGLGVHPVVLAIVVGAVLPPSALGLPPAAVALMLAVIWGMGTQMSPFSATVMQIARLLDVSVFRVAWVWNAPYCLPAAGLAGLAVAGLSALLP